MKRKHVNISCDLILHTTC